MDNKKNVFSNVLKELVRVAGKVVTPISSGFNTPFSRSRANSFTEESSNESPNAEENAEINRERAIQLEQMLINSGFMDNRTAHFHVNSRRGADPRRAVSPINNDYT